MTQVDLAEKSGCSLGALRNWEERKAVPSLDNAIAWAEALGLNLAVAAS